VLFVAHREEILKQAAVSFRNVRNSDDYGFFNGDEKTTDKSVIFASVATLGNERYLRKEYFDSEYFDYIVVDEFHHAVNDQYKRIVDYFKPKFMLGLTATPERMDGRSIYELCDYNVPYEISLFEAINKGMLVPFHYYGIYDDTDYSKLHVVRGRYDEKELNEKLSMHMKQLYGYRYCEPHYNCLKPRIMAEELLIQKDVSFSTTMIDYKFFCINSNVEYCLVCYDRSYGANSSSVMREIYSVNPWRPNHQVMSKLYLNQKFEKQVPEPKNLQTMIQMAKKLSTGFPFVRVDLYNDDGRIYFSELTFTPAGGRLTCFSDAVQLELGSQLSTSKEDF
jgi:hypothetical protein